MHLAKVPLNKLKEVLKAQGRSQKWLAHQLGKSENTLSLWVTNQVQPSVEDLYKVAVLLDVEISDLLVERKDLN
jgi:transcriptional regulator with XRE-family HTH domain